MDNLEIDDFEFDSDYFDYCEYEDLKLEWDFIE